MTRDYDRFASLFTSDGAWRMPHIKALFVGMREIRAAVERGQSLFEFFVQTVHSGPITLDGDEATGRAYVAEFGRLIGGVRTPTMACTTIVIAEHRRAGGSPRAHTS